MLRKIRIVLSIVLFALITFYFVDFAGILPNQFHVLAHIQLVPALLSFSTGILAFLVILTLLFGRVYCSTICPMGIYQDVVRRMGLLFRRKKKRYSFSPAKTILRWVTVVVTVVAFLFGLNIIVALLDPYSAYGRIVVNVLKPVYMIGNNLLESLFSQFDNYTFYQVDASILDITSLVIALITLIVIGYLAVKHGRTWCNTLCPVGTILGLLSRFAFFKIRIDSSKCNNCGACGTKCKASCINSPEHAIDYSRCVGCFDCMDVCRQRALVYKPSIALSKQESLIQQESLSKQESLIRQESLGKQESLIQQESLSKQNADVSKRRFLMAGLITATAAPKVMAQMKEVAAALDGKKAYKKEHPITPPGSVSREHFQRQCTSCHLCVSKCPSHVLKPAFMEYGLEGMMQPTVNFDKGFCNFDCTVCGDVCPNAAIKPLTVKQKHLTQMGYVVFTEENCIVYTDGTSCGACSEHCPTQAIAMVPYKEGLTIPHVDTDICVGCGGCEYVCPARPFRAVHIEGNPVQKEAKPFTEKQEEKVEIDSFGF